MKATMNRAMPPTIHLVGKTFAWIAMGLSIAGSTFFFGRIPTGGTSEHTSATAGDYYVAPDGSRQGDGSLARPWPSVDYALSQVGAGQTIVMRPGLYRGPIKIEKKYAGREGRPTVIRAEKKWEAIVVGSTAHGVSTQDDCHWVTLDGLHVHGAIGDGIKLGGDHNVVRNCWVHHSLDMGIAMHGKTGGKIERNLVEFNGSHIQFHHGIYADGRALVIEGNLVRHNAAYGLHLYPDLRDSSVANNVVFGQVSGRGVIIQSGGGNCFLNNTVVETNQGLNIRKAQGDLAANNIILTRHTTSVEADGATLRNNLTAGEAGFVDLDRGLLWLTAESPARGKSDARFAPADDFWGNPRGESSDLGAMPFRPALTKQFADDRWPHGWPYLRGPQERPPDWWNP